jgi:Co/Zn/Cd efflux system component
MPIERQQTLEHNHNHHEPRPSLKNLLFAMVINGGIVVFEMVFGLLIQSMALISDAVHNLSTELQHEKRLASLAPGHPVFPRRDRRYPDDHVLRLAIDDVVEVNDLHIWQTGTNQKLLSAHLRMTEEASDSEMIVRAAQEMLLHKYGINHTTLQILPGSAGEMEHCNHCN